MTTQAFVLVNTLIGKEQAVLEALRQIPQIMSAYLVFGSYDIILKICAEDYRNLKDIVTKQIRKTQYLKETVTIVIID